MIKRDGKGGSGRAPPTSSSTRATCCLLPVVEWYQYIGNHFAILFVQRALKTILNTNLCKSKFCLYAPTGMMARQWDAFMVKRLVTITG